MKKMTYIIRHREVLVSTYSVEASSEEDAYKKFLDAANAGNVDYSDLELIESENEVIGIHNPLYSTLIEGAIPVYDDESENSNGNDDKKTENKREFNHINDCWNAVFACKSRKKLEKLFEEFPRWSGEWYVELNDDDGCCSVTNFHFDKQGESQEDAYIWCEDERTTDIPWCPDEVEITFSTLKDEGAEDEDFDDEDSLSDIVSDYLSNEFGFCHKGFSLDIDKEKKLVVASEIQWDYSDDSEDENN